ncbi:MAG: CehA/McbA family metallohydrolase [Clostridia bacterium]|nr:CehA/McbA family metallohydrolase [Clostridia bacterium]
MYRSRHGKNNKLSGKYILPALFLALMCLAGCAHGVPDAPQPSFNIPATNQPELPDFIPDDASADDYVLSEAAFSGDLSAGSTITVSGTLENRTGEIRTFCVELERPLIMTRNEGSDTLYIPVEAGGQAEFSFALGLSEGGSGLCKVMLLSENRAVLSETPLRLSVSGRGYYTGDAHTHSTLSDGNDSYRSNFLSVYNKGHAWIYMTDHNFDVSRNSFAKTGARKLEGFLPLVGSEITTYRGHMLEFNTKYRHPAGYTGTMWEIMAAIRPDAAGWQEIIDTVTGEDGLCFIAHPFYTNNDQWTWPGFGHDPEKVNCYTGFTGIEVYNALSRKRDDDRQFTDDAFEFWDRYNLKGEQHYVGICDTDGHDKDTVGTAANALLLDALEEDNIICTLRNGTFYGTNGPELRFSIGGAGCGQTYKLTGNGKADLKIVAADQQSPITKVVLYRYKIEDNVDNAYRSGSVTVLYDDPDGSKGLRLFEHSEQISVSDGEFYRVEVHSVKSLFGDESLEGGFAFSNPVWIEK